MAHSARQPQKPTQSEAEKFLNRKDESTRNARIRGIMSIQTCQEWLRYEHEHQCREDVVERLEGRLRELADRD